MRSTPRPRHAVSPAALAIVRPLMRYSTTRDAYVLRLVGHRFGPVLKRRDAGRQTTAGTRVS